MARVGPIPTALREQCGELGVGDKLVCWVHPNGLSGIVCKLVSDFGAAYPLLAVMDLADQHAMMLRLYAAVFDRDPDEPVAVYWVGQIDGIECWSVRRIASFFAASPEFNNQYGSAVGPADFVDILYRNVLYRTADAGGQA